MDLFVPSAAVVGLAVLAVSQIPGAATIGAGAEGVATLVGQSLYASEAHIDRWGGPVRAEDFALERLGEVAGVLTAPDGTTQGIVVAVGGLWGFGVREVEVGMERLHLVGADGGDRRLVVDLSLDGAAPLPG